MSIVVARLVEPLLYSSIRHNLLRNKGAMFIGIPDLHRAKSDNHIRYVIPIAIYEGKRDGHQVSIWSYNLRPNNHAHMLHISTGHLHNNHPAMDILSDKMTRCFPRFVPHKGIDLHG